MEVQLENFGVTMLNMWGTAMENLVTQDLQTQFNEQTGWLLHGGKYSKSKDIKI